MTSEQREQVAGEARHWVRLTHVCNNRCLFCLDSDAQHGGMRPRAEVEADIDEGRALGATRLILSGGEATIHPEFTDLVGYGKAAGYGHVQTISNGRMFAYRWFADAALAAGLDEVTFSVHGHTAELHDELTGVPGSFAQTVAGIRNMVGRCVVSGDVVINRRNVRHLRDVLDLFAGLGVHEYDLLMVVPFGRAWPGDHVLFDPAEHLDDLHRAFELADSAQVHLWTNRLAPELLEGREDLIQDPHKLHDEVRGRRDLWDDLVEGRPMRCEGKRCERCFIAPLCRAMADAATQLQAGVPGALRVHGEIGQGHRELVARGRESLWIHARSAREARELAAGCTARALWFELDELDGIGEDLDERVRIVVPVHAGTAGHLGTIPADRLAVCQAPYPSLAEAACNHTDIRAALRGVNAAEVVDMPPCLSGLDRVSYVDPVPLDAVGPDGKLVPEAYVEHFVAYRYRVKSLRCRACVHDGVCRGIGVQLARTAGFGLLAPVAGG